MRPLLSGALALFVALVLVVAGMRWLGLQRQGTPFPLPDDAGCWQTICFLGAEDIADVASTLRGHPAVRPASVRVHPDPQTRDDALVEFVYAPRAIRVVPALLYWTPYTYSLTRDWRDVSNPALLSVGHVVAAVGVPEQVIFLPDQVVLTYPARGLHVSIRRAPTPVEWVILSPDDPVIGLSVTRMALEQSTIGAITYQPHAPWRGFGVYRVPP